MSVELFSEADLLNLPDVHEAVPVRLPGVGFQPKTVHQATAIKLLHLMEQVKVVDNPVGIRSMKVKWKEFEALRLNPDFIARAKYEQHFLYLADGVTPRRKPLRPIVQNECGMLYRGNYRQNDPRRDQDTDKWYIVYLADAGPDDVGEGKYFQVPKDAPIGEKNGGD